MAKEKRVAHADSHSKELLTYDELISKLKETGLRYHAELKVSAPTKEDMNFGISQFIRDLIKISSPSEWWKENGAQNFPEVEQNLFNKMYKNLRLECALESGLIVFESKLTQTKPTTFKQVCLMAQFSSNNRFSLHVVRGKRSSSMLQIAKEQGLLGHLKYFLPDNANSLHSNAKNVEKEITFTEQSLNEHLYAETDSPENAAHFMNNSRIQTGLLELSSFNVLTISEVRDSTTNSQKILLVLNLEKETLTQLDIAMEFMNSCLTVTGR